MTLTASRSLIAQHGNALMMEVAPKARGTSRLPDWLREPCPPRSRRHRPSPKHVALAPDEVIAVVEVALAAREPERALADRLCQMQEVQRARFARLPERLKHCDWVLLRHGQLLRRNQGIHDAAREILRLIRSWSRAD